MKKKDLKQEIAVLKKESSQALTEIERRRLSWIIHKASLASASVGAGLAQIPASDSAIIVPIQLNMLRRLGQEFGLSLTDQSAEAIISTAISSFLGRGLSQFLLGSIPLAGNIINASTAGLITELMGWTIVKLFILEDKKTPPK